MHRHGHWRRWHPRCGSAHGPCRCRCGSCNRATFLRHTAVDVFEKGVSDLRGVGHMQDGRTLRGYGTVRSTLDIVQAVSLGDHCATVPQVDPGGELLLSVLGWPKVAQVFRLIDAIEASGIRCACGHCGCTFVVIAACRARRTAREGWLRPICIRQIQPVPPAVPCLQKVRAPVRPGGSPQQCAASRHAPRCVRHSPCSAQTVR